MAQVLQGDESAARVQPLPPPSFLSLPDALHGSSIASFLPDGDKGNARLHVSEVMGVV